MPLSRPRLADVAQLAGVSKSTVSSVINNRVDEANRVSPETQQRVWDAVHQLGFVANPVARSLAGGHNRLLGVFTYEPIFPLRYRNFFFPFLVGIENAAEQAGFNLVLFTNTPTVNSRRAIFQQDINSLRLADGAILLGLHEDKSEIKRLIREKYPFVFIGHREIDEGIIPYVAYDATSATIEIMQHLFQLGHCKIAYYRLPQDNEPSSDRQNGYIQALEQAGTPINKAWIIRTLPEAIDIGAIKKLIETGITAVVAETGAIAARILDLAHSLGKTVPEDLSIAVLGDPIEAQETVEWTMFSIPREQIGREAVQMLIGQISHPDSLVVKPVDLPCQFIPGKTTGLNRSPG
jgi:DNA-binding LacI/PurR family transcriptional regulator